MTLVNLGINCDRACVSNRSVALLPSSVLQDIGIIKGKNVSVIDRHGIVRIRAKCRSDEKCSNKLNDVEALISMVERTKHRIMRSQDRKIIW